MLVEASGTAPPETVWRRFTDPSQWPSRAPQIRAVATADSELRVGGSGRVSGPGPLAVDYDIVEIDADLRVWTWEVAVGPARARMRHYVLPTATGGSRALLQVEGPTAVPAQAYRPMARAALRRLVAMPSPTPAVDASSVDEQVVEHGLPSESVRAFRFAFSPAYAAAARPFGITPATTSVEVGPHWLYVRYGPWRLLTPRVNVVAAQVSGDFSFVKTAGPAHLSLSDRGVTMTSNGHRAICLEFAEPVTAIDTTGLIRHPGATLAVADPEGLAAALGVGV
ncbi:MAG: SRPBCC family protein [Nocardioides sp.]